MRRWQSVEGVMVILAGLAASWTGVSAAGQPPDRPWHGTALVGLEIGPTGSQFGSSPSDTRFAERFDGRAIVRAARDANAQYLVIWAREGDWAFYETDLQPRPPGLAGRDVLREAVEEGRQVGLPIIAYCQVQYPGHTLREHPDWRMVDALGQPIEGRVCFRSGYLEFMKTMVKEMLAYGIDGFHLDMVDQGFGPPYGCWCDHCRSAFRQRYGRAMPDGVTWDETWDQMLDFRYDSSAQFEKMLTDHIRQIDPQVSVDFNYHGNPPFSWEVGQRPVQHAVQGDFVTGETGIWGFSALTVGLNAEFYKAATPGRRFQVAIQRGVRAYHDQTTRPLNDLRWELFTLLSHGAFVTMVDKTAFDGWLDPVAYQRFGEAFAEVARKRSHFGQPSVYEAGLYFSSRTRDWYGRDRPAEASRAFQGAHKAMAYDHVPWGVLLDENLSLESLRRFPVVVLPNVAILSPVEVALLTRYVEEGGHLLVTGCTGTRDRWGKPTSESALSALIGARLLRELDTQDNWLRFAPRDATGPLADLVSSVRADWPFLVRGPAVVYEPTTAIPVGELLRPHRTALHTEGRYPAEYPMSADTPVGPAALWNQVGAGVVLTLSASPDWATASDHAIVEARTLLTAGVRQLNPAPQVRIEAPVNVQAVVTEDPVGGTLRVHLLGYNTPPQTTPATNRPYVLPALIEDPPLYRATIELRELPRAARALSPATLVEQQGRTIRLQVEEIHEVVIIDP